MNSEVALEKGKLISIIKRIVVDEVEKNHLIDLIEGHPHSIPLRAVLEKLRILQTLPLNAEENEIMDDLKFIYI